MAQREPTEEEIYGDDKDPIDAIYEIRRNEEDGSEENLESLEQSREEASLATGAKEEEEEEEVTLGSKAEEEEEEEGEKVKPEDGETGKDAFEKEGEEAENPDEPEGEEGSSDNKPSVRKYTADGKEYEFTEDEIFEQFGTVFGQAMNYTQKMQKIAPYRKMISALEEEGITEDRFNVAVDALKGNKEAIQQLMKENNIDPLDIDPETENSEYQPTQYGKTDFQQQIEEVTSKISGDPEYSTTVDVIQNRWDSASKSEFAKNPAMISGLHNDIKSGLYEKVVPIAAKLKVLDGNSKSDIEYYMLAGEQVGSQERSNQDTVESTNKQTQAAVKDSDQASSEAQRKRAAASTRTRADKKGVIDYLEDDDEKFDEWYQSLVSKN